MAGVAAEVEGMRREIGGVVGAGSGGGGGGTFLPEPEEFEEDADGYREFEQERQMEMMAEQDEALDGVFRTVGNLRAQADEMGRELEEQGELLEGVDNLADRVGGKLQVGLKKVGWVIKKNEGEFFPPFALEACFCLEGWRWERWRRGAWRRNMC